MREIHATHTQSVPIDQAGTWVWFTSHFTWKLTEEPSFDFSDNSFVHTQQSFHVLFESHNLVPLNIDRLVEFHQLIILLFHLQTKEKRGNCVKTRWFFRSWMSSCLEQLVERISDIACSITTSRWKSHKISRAIIHSKCNACELLMGNGMKNTLSVM